MVIIIGDAPPNSIKDVELKRDEIERLYRSNRGYKVWKNKNYWENTKNYKVATNWEQEI